MIISLIITEFECIYIGYTSASSNTSRSFAHDSITLVKRRSSWFNCLGSFNKKDKTNIDCDSHIF